MATRIGSTKLQAITQQTVTNKAADLAQTEKGRQVAKIYFPKKQIKITTEIDISQIKCIQKPKSVSSQKHFQPVQMGQFMQLVQPLRKLSAFEIEPVGRTVQVVTQDEMVIGVRIRVKVNPIQSFCQQLPLLSQRFKCDNSFKLRDSNVILPRQTQREIERIYARIQTVIIVESKKEELTRRVVTTVQHYDRFQTCALRKEMSTVATLLFPRFHTLYSLQHFPCFKATEYQRAEKQQITAQKTARGIKIPALPQEEKPHGYNQTEAPNGRLLYMYRHHVHNYERPEPLTNVLTGFFLKNTRARPLNEPVFCAAAFQAMAAAEQQPYFVEFKFEDVMETPLRADPPETEAPETPLFVALESDKQKKGRSKSQKRAQSSNTFKITTAGDAHELLSQRRESGQSLFTLPGESSIRFAQDAKPTITENIVETKEAQERQDAFQQQLTEELTGLMVHTLTKINAIRLRLDSKIPLNDVPVQQYYNEHAGEIRFKVKDPREATAADRNETMLVNIEREASAFAICLTELIDREKKAGNPEAEKIELFRQAEATFVAIAKNSNLTLLTRLLLSKFDAFRSSTLVSIIDFQRAYQEHQAALKQLLEMIIKREQALGKLINQSNVDPRALDRLNQMLKREEQVRCAALKQTNVDELHKILTEYRAAYTLDVSL